MIMNSRYLGLVFSKQELVLLKVDQLYLQFCCFAEGNLANGKLATLSHDYIPNDYKASKAVDCDLTTRATSTSSTANGLFAEGDYWWKVDIGERIIFTYATIYVRDGECGNPIFNCCKYWYMD